MMVIYNLERHADMTHKLGLMVGQSTRATEVLCAVDGCELKANRVGAGLCEKHYTRMRRRGTTDSSKRKFKIANSNGYVLLAADAHPLMADKPSGSRVYEHRVVFFDAHGGGIHTCHWCNASINFDDMHVDHLNAVTDDNRIENLVAACPRCNKSRGIEKMRVTMQNKGLMITWGGKTKHVSEWANDLGISSVSLKYRIKSGWSIEDALTKPRGKTGPRRT